MMRSVEGEREENDGVLLYYKYAASGSFDVKALVDTYDSNCRSLGLVGRIRIAQHGVNVTIGGKMSALEKHIEVMRNTYTLFEGTDFKLASCGDAPHQSIANQCGFTSLSIRLVKELVTFTTHPLLKLPSISHAGKHLSATEFHSVLHNAIARKKLDIDGSLQHKGLILLDARNVYETKIGMFKAPQVETVNPEIRQYSDLSTWIDENSQRLKGNHVLMYCTGGIRCEMASAYIRSKGEGYENVYQLFGGIQRYLEQFPDGGFFKGKNFVFDHRISIGSKSPEILGACLLCDAAFDDYSPRCRCVHCRMLVLVCGSCQRQGNTRVVCELCQKHRKSNAVASVIEGYDSGCPVKVSVEPELDHVNSYANTSSVELHRSNGIGLSRKLRILCLHGFRQNASSFKGRTGSLIKKLKNIVEFVFVDAPHELPFIYQPSNNQIHDSTSSRQWHPPPQENCKKRFAWMVSELSNRCEEPNWKMADGPFDPNQYQYQTGGFEESHAYLQNIFSLMGPFDGVLGFSQGAAMLALVCEELQRRGGTSDFRFAIFCSGFSMLPHAMSSGSINFPSLHVFGSSKGQDRQISCNKSRDLAKLFDSGCSTVIEHDMGHIIPAKPPYVDQMRAFLQRFI